MTLRPSNVQTAFCSSSRTRSLGATPFSRNSFSCSLTYCNGFCLIICVPCSDIELLPLSRDEKSRFDILNPRASEAKDLSATEGRAPIASKSLQHHSSADG